MSNKNLALLALVGVLTAVYLYQDKLFKKDWDGRKAEFTAVVSDKFLHSGAPSVEVANQVATCLSETLVSAAKKANCPAEGDDVLKAMGQCLSSSQEMQVVFQMAMLTCTAEAGPQ